LQAAGSAIGRNRGPRLTARDLHGQGRGHTGHAWGRPVPAISTEGGPRYLAVPITGTSRTHSPSSGTGIRLLPMAAPAREEGNAEERPTDLTERLVAIPSDRILASASGARA